MVNMPLYKKPSDIPLRVLTQLGRRLLLHPLATTPEPDMAGLTKEEAQGLDTLMQKSRTNTEGLRDSATSRTQVLNLINGLIHKHALSPTAQGLAKDRLGQRGDLWPSAYTLTFAPFFADFERLGHRKAHVSDVIARPDAVEHVLPELVAAEGFPAVSLLAKRNVVAGKNVITVVQAERAGSILEVRAAWHILPEVYERVKDSSLVALLRAFVESLGVDLRVPGRNWTKFIYYESIQVDAPVARLEDLVSFRTASAEEVMGALMFRMSSAGLLEVALAYGIDAKAYRLSVWGR